MINNWNIETKLGLRYYSGGSSSGSGSGFQKSGSQNSSSSSGSSLSKSTPQMTPQQLLSLYQTALPSMLSTANTASANSPGAPAMAAANRGAVAGVNAINMNGLSPGEANSVERSTNQANLATGNLGNSNAMNTIGNAMNFGGAFNSKIPLLNASTNTAAGVANAGSNTLGATTGVFNPLAANASAPISNSNSIFSSAGSGGSWGTGVNSSQNNSGSIGCFLTTACCQHKGLPDDCEELQTLRKFRDYFVPKELVAEYYKIAPKLVRKVQDKPKVLDYIYDTIRSCVDHIKRSENEQALHNYKTMVNYLHTL